MRIEILYDFDYNSLKYYRDGLNNHPSKQFLRSKENYNLLDVIKTWNSIEPLYLLGTGMDKICIAESDSNNCLIIEPCPALFFICKMEEVFTYFINELNRGNTNPSDGGIYVLDDLFRPSGDRDYYDIHVGVSLEKKDEIWIISFGRSGFEKILQLPMDSFLSAYFEFGERMISFYDHVLPEYKEFKYQYPLFMKAIKDSIIKKKFKVEPQSIYDDKTYYDYQ